MHFDGSINLTFGFYSFKLAKKEFKGSSDSVPNLTISKGNSLI